MSTAVAAAVVVVIVLAGAFLAYAYLGTGGSNASTSTTSSSSSLSSTSSASSTSTSMTSTTSSTSATSSTSVGPTTSTTSVPPCCSTNLVRIGYFANINHAQSLIGLFNGDYQNAVGPTVQIQTTLFTAGPTEMTALLAGQLDMAYVGPSPAVNAWIAANSTSLRIIAGASDGGALFVVSNSSGITTAAAGGVTAQLQGKTFLAPQLGNTQDIALRTYLLNNHLVPGVNVTVQDTSNSNIVTAMVAGKADGAWVPQPYGSTIISKASAHLFLDERSLWPGGNFSTAELVASTAFINNHPDVVQRIVNAHVYETLWISSHLSQAAQEMNATILAKTGNGVSANVMTASLATLTFTYDPLASSVQQQANDAFQLGFLKTQPNVTAIFDLTFLNAALAQRDLPPVTA